MLRCFHAKQLSACYCDGLFEYLLHKNHVYFAVVQGQIVWQELLCMEDPHLKCLAKSLFTTDLNSKVASITKKYMYAFNHWMKWAQSLSNINMFAVKPVHLALYIQHLGDSKQSRAAVKEATYAIAWIHQMAGLLSPSSNPLVYRVLSISGCMWLAVLKLLAQLQCLSDIWTWVVCQTPLEYCSIRWKKGVSSCIHLANCHTLVYESCCWTGWNLLGSLSQP